MNKNIKVNAAILIIGNEILSGRTQDTNTSTIATWLNTLGVTVGEVRVIPDVEKTIISTLNLLRKNYNYVFTTGGIGPTHDDITSESISKAFNLKYDYHKEAFNILEKYYIKDIQKFKDEKKKFATITAYDYLSAKLVEELAFPLILVGDSASMVVYGYTTTIPVSMNEMLIVTKAVCRGAKRSLVVADMPFLSFTCKVRQTQGRTHEHAYII